MPGIAIIQPLRQDPHSANWKTFSKFIMNMFKIGTFKSRYEFREFEFINYIFTPNFFISVIDAGKEKSRKIIGCFYLYSSPSGQ